METYAKLREEFIKISKVHIDSAALSRLKLCYSREIDSKRTLGYIQNLEYLIRILEKRDVLRYDCIEPLKYISTEFIKDSTIEAKLINYETSLQNVVNYPLYNSYANSKAIPSAPTSSEHKCNNSNYGQCSTMGFTQPQFQQAECKAYSNIQSFYSTQPTCPTYREIQYQTEISVRNTPNSFVSKETKLQDTVLFSVSERLGRYWRDVVRFLDIRECDIDAIESKFHLDLKEKAYEGLKMFVSQSDPRYWKMNLMRALEKARRKDLKEMVEELLTRKE